MTLYYEAEFHRAVALWRRAIGKLFWGVITEAIELIRQ